MPPPDIAPSTQVQTQWLESLRTRDPKLHAELVERLEGRIAAEGVAIPESADAEPPQRLQELVLETIVREGRPALSIRGNRIGEAGPAIEAAAKEIVRRLKDAAPAINPVIPLIGRIDVANHPRNLPYVGTGWLVDSDVVVTNRHVAELIARPEGRQFQFRLDAFGDPLAVSMDYLHEQDETASVIAPVLRVIWIESDPRKADIAFLQVGRRPDAGGPAFIQLAEADLSADSDVVVIGYPARAPAHVIPDQARMDAIYGGIYDVKRVAPGLIGPASRGWMTHDCTTLGGNSGSVVLDMKTGRAVGLHFAGLYLIENYAVPASTVRRYLTTRPWHFQSVPSPRPSTGGTVRPQSTTTTSEHQVNVSPDGGTVSFTLPLRFTVSIGPPEAARQTSPRTDGAASRRDVQQPIEAAARDLFQQRTSGVLAVRPGYLIVEGRLSDQDCLVVAVAPPRLDDVRASVPETFAGYPVDVRPASLWDQAAAISPAFDEEAVTSISYNDDDRTGPGFSFAIVDEPMTVLLHVGPERSWTTLSEFLAQTQDELVSSIYEFHAKHIADAIGQTLDEGARLSLVMATQSRDPRQGRVKKGDFDRSARFARWEQDFGNKFERVFVPLGADGLVAMSYHIKVSVRDKRFVWLSSGNWKHSSQPVIDAADLDNPDVTTDAGNREWHVVIESTTLAERFRNHILEDLNHSLALGGTPEAIEEQVLVDVPIMVMESVVAEAPAREVLQPKEINRRVRVKPLLTPDKEGAVYSQAVRQLIESASQQLLFQIPYIKAGNSSGFLDDLIVALIAKSNELDDFRIIVRADGSGLLDDLSALKRRGLDVERCVRRVNDTHTKGMVVDGERVLIGSHNWSSLGVTLNRDASLIFHDREIAEYYRAAFELDWERARDISLETVLLESLASGAPRLAVGSVPPPGFVRMTLADYLEG